MSLLTLTNLQIHYGGINAVKGIDLCVEEGELVTLIGANGAGKTSTLNAIAGLLPYSGSIHYADENLQAVPTYARVSKGLVLVPEGRGIFPRLSVYENLLMGAFHRRDQAQINTDLAQMLAWFPRLAERAKQAAGTLSGGEQQMLAMSRALMGRPRLLLLDEPSMGLAPIMIDKIFDIIQKIKAQGVSILLIEQNARMALAAADRAYVLESGSIYLQGSAQTLLHDERVLSAYLGH
jgi:branched-chain amino acid transport system ATP-binding protein